VETTHARPVAGFHDTVLLLVAISLVGFGAATGIREGRRARLQAFEPGGTVEQSMQRR
jgi:hypothetical protein